MCKFSIRWLLTLIAIVSVSLAACVPIAPPQPSTPASGAQSIALKIGYAGWVGEGPLFIARDKGYFQEEGLSVEPVLFEDPKARFAALADQQLDGLLAAVAPMTLYWKAETPFAAILAIDEAVGADGILVRKDAHINTVKDLKGKRVGVNMRSIGHFILAYVLKQNGLSESDVTLVQMQPADVPAALSSGQLEAGVTWEPHLAKAKADPKLAILLTSKDLPGLEVDALVVRKDVLAQNKAVGAKLVRAWEKAVAYQKAHPDEAAMVLQQALNKFYKTPADVLADMKNDVLFDQARNIEFFKGDGPSSAIGVAQAAIDFWTEQGQMTTTVKAENMIDGSYLLSSADQTRATRIDALLTKLNAEGVFNGSVLLAHNGQVLLSKGYGLADREQKIPNTSKTRFRISGLTKSFTVLAILLLQEQGKLKVEDSVCQYISDCPPTWQPITIHHLLTNNAGLYDFRQNTYAAGQLPTPSTSLQVLDRVKAQTLDFHPGSGPRFSNGGFIVAGYLIEQVSGQSYEQFLQTQLFTPLGLQNTGYAHDAGTLAVGYRDTINKALPVDGSLPFASSGLYSTVDDLYRYTQAIMSGKLLEKKSYDLFFHPHVKVVDENNDGFTPGYGQPAYGYGWAIATFKDHRLIGHDGAIEGYGSDLRLYPDDGFTMILLANQKVWAAQIGDTIAEVLFAIE